MYSFMCERVLHGWAKMLHLLLNSILKQSNYYFYFRLRYRTTPFKNKL